ncbi:hypothetical protein CABS03_03659 [Colletotrichum abscissum]|uniref:Uncharacterized protein n=1 Tax=Colletotrichum abscissum TaxID=1671311 RepID=A0A9Q0AZD1_9PEZI|nr:hypothetical protein CABS02_13273 [Colletotrichum abscissum]
MLCFSSSRPEKQAPARNEKREKRIRACQTSIDTHPFHAPKGKTAIGDEIITALYTAPPHREGAPLSLRKVRGQPEFFTLGCRGYQSSTRVGSVAPLGNQE